MDPKDITLLIRKWEENEAELRKENRKYEDAQERAERAIMLGHDYDGHSKQKP